ncbi:hypothetical protein V5799_031133 [Amblyomma americanum]|uniref:Uncharacterized protein n=1 Tax=Amblyomma americanum TaxID=6943 RepID=A0AAQ4ELN1_AMBAM
MMFSKELQDAAQAPNPHGLPLAWIADFMMNPDNLWKRHPMDNLESRVGLKCQLSYHLKTCKTIFNIKYASWPAVLEFLVDHEASTPAHDLFGNILRYCILRGKGMPITHSGPIDDSDIPEDMRSNIIVRKALTMLTIHNPNYPTTGVPLEMTGKFRDLLYHRLIADQYSCIPLKASDKKPGDNRKYEENHSSRSADFEGALSNAPFIHNGLISSKEEHLHNMIKNLKDVTMQSKTVKNKGMERTYINFVNEKMNSFNGVNMIIPEPTILSGGLHYVLWTQKTPTITGVPEYEYFILKSSRLCPGVDMMASANDYTIPVILYLAIHGALFTMLDSQVSKRSLSNLQHWCNKLSNWLFGIEQQRTIKRTFVEPATTIMLNSRDNPRARAAYEKIFIQAQQAASVLNSTSSANESVQDPQNLIRSIRGGAHLEFLIRKKTVNGQKIFVEDYKPLFAGRGDQYDKNKRYIGYMNMCFQPILHNGAPTLRITFGSCIMKPYTQNFNESVYVTGGGDTPLDIDMALELPFNYINDDAEGNEDEKDSIVGETCSVTSEEVPPVDTAETDSVQDIYGPPLTSLEIDTDGLSVDFSAGFKDRKRASEEALLDSRHRHRLASNYFHRNQQHERRKTFRV